MGFLIEARLTAAEHNDKPFGRVKPFVIARKLFAPVVGINVTPPDTNLCNDAVVVIAVVVSCNPEFVLTPKIKIK